MKKFNPFPYIFIFLATFLILQMFQNDMEVKPVTGIGDFTMEMTKDDYAIGKDIKVELTNNTSETITIPSNCPDAAFEVFKYSSEGYVPVTSDLDRNCDDVEDIVLKPGEKLKHSLLDYSYSLFGEIGRYKLEVEIGEKTYSTPEFQIEEPGIITRAWRNIVYKPILNTLVTIIIYLPGHYLWLSIVILTLIVRTILLAPSLKATRAQRAMQDIQPKLNKLKEKYKDDQARLAQETMHLWKEHKVHPLSSCLPMLIQFPILIALFHVVQAGLSPDRSILLYGFLAEFSLADINPYFINFNLLERSLLILPIIIGGLQFFQMQLMMARKKKQTEEKSAMPEMETANKMMKYMMPLMIAFFTAQLPAAVGFYWGTSTFYGIIQQLVVNREGSTKPSKKEDDVKVRVITKKHGKEN